MSTVVKDLGAVSAYAYAVEKGYTGTEAEFAELMADYAEVGQRAEDAAESTLNSKTAAQTAAQTATAKAGEAQTSAQTASSKASEASGYASTASAKATESAQSATNAQGYAQTAEQAKTASQTAQGLAEGARDTAQGYAEDAQGYANDAQASAESVSASASQIAQNTADILKAFPTDTASGAVASFTDGADGIPLKSLVVNIDPVQDTSSGDPSPENICPISGWTEVDVEQSGVNVWDEEWEVGMFNPQNGNKITDASRVRSKNFIPCQPDTDYYYSCNSRTYAGNLCVLFYGANNYLGHYDFNPNHSFTTPTGCHYMMFYTGSAYGTTYNHDISINYPSTDHDYHPYTGRSITISLGQTVYGGKLDVLTGILTVYPYYASYNGETLTDEWISDRDVYVSGTTPTIGAQVVNVGAEGTEIQLEPHEVASLLGQNNIFADTGDVSCEYRADTKLYIEKLTQPEEDDMIADSAITSGQFFMVGNTLYRALANIASGATITVGTNAQRVSLSDALNLVNS